MELHFSPEMDYATTLLWDKGKERPGGKDRKADGYTYSIYIYQENEENLSLKLQMRHVQNIKCQQEKNTLQMTTLSAIWSASKKQEHCEMSHSRQ